VASRTKKRDLRIEITEEEINQLIDEIESSNLSEESRDKLITTLETLVCINDLLDLKETTIARLRAVFNKKSEKAKAKPGSATASSPPGTGTNNGRNGQDQYPTAESVFHHHETLKAGQTCPECGGGTLYKYEPGVSVKITGHAPLRATIHRTEKLRCSACLAIFEASCAGQAGDKYDARAKAVIALLKYAASTPFYRLEKIQKSLLTPLPASTQWDLMEELANDLHPIWKAQVQASAQADLGHIDDTTAKILSLMKDNRLEQNRKSEKQRQGMYTTGILAKLPEGRIVVLYFTGRKVAGENLDKLLDKRESAEPMVIMSDALGANHPRRHEVYESLCNSHARRKFVDMGRAYETESKYVVGLIGEVYHNESQTVEMNLNPIERMEYHQEHSEKLMNELEEWCRLQLDEKKVEPNSTLGKGIKYVIKHWVELTHFYRVPGVPLDNNILEEKLRLPVLNRKNFLFYKTELGAFVGDIIMSTIKTCDVNKINPIEYLTAVQENRDRVKQEPQAWLPWNYKTQLQ
jgi:transposase